MKTFIQIAYLGDGVSVIKTGIAQERRERSQTQPSAPRSSGSPRVPVGQGMEDDEYLREAKPKISLEARLSRP